jgi:hypothetical protein
MSKGMFTLLKAKQIPIRLGNPPKKLTTGDKIKPLSFQKVGLESKQPGVIGLGYFIMPFKMGKC